MEEEFTVRYNDESPQTREQTLEERQEKVDLSYTRAKLDAAGVFDPSNRTYAVYLSDEGATSNLTYSVLENLSISPQSDLSKTQQIIAINRQYVNKNDIIGITAESIENNINTEVRLAYKTPKRGSFKKTDIDMAKLLIADFNEKINLPNFIIRAITTTFIEGTFIAYRRKVDKDGSTDYVVDFYPLGTALISDYEVGGDPYVMVDIGALKSALQKSYPKNRKRKGLFFENMDEEVKVTYPEEVYRAYIAKETYAKLDIESTCVLRIGNQNKKYGLSPIFRAIYPALMLESFEDADRSNAKARAKKIIVQTMNKEILGPEYSRNTYAEQAYAHKNFLDAWKQKTVVVTTPPAVRGLEYVEPKVEMTNIDTVNYYRSRVMSTLGISFLVDSGSQSLSVANISLRQLMKRINRISKQLESTLVKWYKGLLRDNGLNPELAPSVKIIDAEMMESSMKMELVNTLFTKLNCSYETAFDVLGFSVEDEKLKREAENKEKLDEIFAPRITAYTASGKENSNPTSEPQNQDEGKSQYDKDRYQNTKQ